MSLLNVWLNEQFAAVCCDGRLSKWDDGKTRLIPVREDYVKFQILTEGIVLGSTGSEFVFASLTPWARALAAALEAEHQGSKLFQRLEITIPAQARTLVATGAKQFDEPPEVALVLVGFDVAQGRIRCVTWRSEDNFIPVEREPGTGCFGNDNAVLVARPLLKQLNDAQPNPRLADVLPDMERIVVSAAEQVPHSVNKNVKSHLIVAPGKRRDCVADGTRAAWTSVTQRANAVDSNGNLLLKNINNIQGSIAGPIATTSISVIADMTKTLTTKGNPISINFSCGLDILLSGGTLTYWLFRDGSILSPAYQIILGSGQEATISLTYTDTPSAGSHTYDLRWQASASNAFQGIGVSRATAVTELG